MATTFNTMLAELEAAYRQVQDALDSQRRFVADASHELRTPLTSIRSFSEILLDDPRTRLDDRVRFLGIIVKETERLTRLINQMLDMAKIESGAEWHASDVDVVEIVQESAEATSQLFRDKAVQLTLSAEGPIPQVRADRDRLMQVLLNLLSNAVKFTPAGGEVRVVVADRSDRVELAVEDNGIGIEPERIEGLFAPFVQLDGALTRARHGAGLGLAISRELARGMGVVGFAPVLELFRTKMVPPPTGES